MQNEIEILASHIEEKGLKYSSKREQILHTFLQTNKHISAQDLFELVKKENPEIGYTTVYRTLKLMVDSGLAEVVDFGDGVRRFECKIGREHHAHFICTKCGKNAEVFDEKIKDLSLRLAQEKGFLPQNQRFEIFGVCVQCE